MSTNAHRTNAHRTNAHRTNAHRTNAHRTNAHRTSATRFRWLLPAWAATIVTVIAGGCGGYPPVSTEAFELAKAVSNLCNARSAEQIPKARHIIGERHDAAAITPRERQFLIEILDVAERGDWDGAESQCRRLLADQTNW